ncbi:MAG: hypothetical protein AMJ64_13855 [Betaproteobacteria bacterium SG8_39]|nr:MAG: hypothetical protein AMJ64_13855 [Betaproteobacteria bacterium SG8_39]
MIRTLMLLSALAAAPVVESNVKTADCTVRIEALVEAGRRPYYRLRPECELSRASTLTALDALRVSAPAGREISVGFGRIVLYPWLSSLLAREASSAPGWDAARGLPRQGHENAFVARLLARSPEFAVLFAGRRIVSVLVEKVLVRPAGELDLPAGAPFPASALFPFDAQLWVVLAPR